LNPCTIGGSSRIYGYSEKEERAFLLAGKKKKLSFCLQGGAHKKLLPGRKKEPSSTVGGCLSTWTPEAKDLAVHHLIGKKRRVSIATLRKKGSLEFLSKTKQYQERIILSSEKGGKDSRGEFRSQNLFFKYRGKGKRPPKIIK